MMKKGAVQKGEELLVKALSLTRDAGAVRVLLDLFSHLEDALQNLSEDPPVGHFAQHLVELMRDQRSAQKKDEKMLTPREQQVLKLLAEGNTYKQICQELFISMNTMKTYAYRIYQKLEVKNRHQAIAKAQELDLLPE